MEMTNRFSTVSFADIYDNMAEFIGDYEDFGFPRILNNTSLMTLYLLLYGRYGNNPIANRDIAQWKIKLFSVVFMYGPTWEKKLDIQDKLRKLSEDDLLRSGKAIHNRAYNPDTEPGTASLTELSHINDQSTSTTIRPKVEAYGILWEMLANDVSEDFIAKFKPLFKIFVSAENPLLFFNADGE